MKAPCLIAGGGPAGMMLGLLLARAGVRVVVFEKHADFLRDFRGDTIHPSTLEIMDELGLLEAVLALPHQQAVELRAHVGDRELRVADFSHLPTRCKFILRRHFLRPSSMDNITNEGLAVSHETHFVSGQKPFYCTDDGQTNGHALRADTIP